MFRTGKFVVTVHRLVVALGWRVGEGDEKSGEIISFWGDENVLYC